jgi:4a-hydroxytetrahydrobiopterin dehydratase
VPDLLHQSGHTLARKAAKLRRDFGEAFAFMTRVALLAEKMDHHPEWRNTWNTVHIALSTHSAGGVITQKDRALAAAIDRLLP